MKIGILTFTYGDNFGQRLQNLALQNVLKNTGNEVLTIRQIEPPKKIIYEIKQFIKGCIGMSNYLDILKRRCAFKRFDKQYINYYNRPIGDKNIPKSINKDFDYFICGSDQIWSPFSGDVNDTLFITFAERKKRVSYAASISADYIPEEKRADYIRRLQGFQRISIRENNMIEWIERNTGIKASVHIDPTLLFDINYWNTIVKRPKRLNHENYVLCYFLGNNTEMQALISKYKLNQEPIVDLMNDKHYYDIRPDEFLYLIQNAKAIITDSYHGTLFSILFHKQFVIAQRSDGYGNMSSRFTTIDKLLSLEGRRSSNLDADKFFSKIDYEMIDNILEKQRKISQDYFDECLK